MRWLLVIVVLCGCSKIWKPKREKPIDKWSMKAAVLHSMMSVPAEFSIKNCDAASTPDLTLFCQKQCNKIGELSLKAYCTWDCDEVKNPDLGVICKLEVKLHEKKTPKPEECDAIDASNLKEHCKQWVGQLPQKKK